MDALLVRHYIKRATDFYESMRTLLAEDQFQSSRALLAIHSAISYSDALRTGLGDENLYGDDHVEAMKVLRSLLLSRRHKDDSGLLHFRYLLSVKSAACYGPKRLDANELQRITTKAEQFANWVTKTGIELKMEGWTHDDQ